MARWLNLVGIGVALLACQLASARPIDGDSAVENAMLAGALEAPEGSEPQAVYVASDVAERKQRRLTLRIGNGTLRVLEDDRICESAPLKAACTRYVLAGYLRTRNLFVLAKFRGDARSYLILDGTDGTETTTDGVPQLSPSGQSILIFDPKRDATLATILRRQNGRFVREWSGKLDDSTGATSSLAVTGWASNDAVLFRRTIWKRAGDPAFTSVWSKVLPTHVETLVELRRTGRTWQHTDRPPPTIDAAKAKMRWNWRTVWLSSVKDLRVDTSVEPSGYADVLFGDRTIAINFDGIEFEIAGKIAKDGTITGVEIPNGDAGAALVVGKHREMRLPGYQPQCKLEEIILRYGSSERDVLPNGSVTILVKQLPDECQHGPDHDGE